MTERLLEWRQGSPEALERLIPLVYAELRYMARDQLRDERPEHTLQPTALIHEMFLRLPNYRRICWEDRAHFFAVAAEAMRRILVDHARKRGAAKRGGSWARVTLAEGLNPAESVDVDVIALNEALSRLEEVDTRQSQIVELRYFGGLSLEETAHVVGVSLATVKRDWSVAKLWLRRELERGAAR